MFEIGQAVIITSFTKPIRGVILSWYYDEGDVWEVETEDSRTIECCNSELETVLS